MRRLKRAEYYASILISLMVVFTLGVPGRAQTPEAMRSPENQVFQFMTTGTCNTWTTGSTTKATAYLWIPEQSKRLRGLLILCTNVPEHMLVGHEKIRQVCAKHDLGIIWSVPTFMNFKAKKEYGNIAGFLQQLLNKLAEKSGYDEVATVPWLPMGESGHLLMVDALVEHSPERCIAGVYIKNNHLPPANREVPVLVLYGTAQEWGQPKSDIRTKWNHVGKDYANILEERAKNPNWPLSYVIDGHSGHFDCSERLVEYMSEYLDAVAQARLSKDGSNGLQPIKLESGFLADLPVMERPRTPIRQFAEAPQGERGVPWYFTREQAEAAQSIAGINWSARTQFVGAADAEGKPLPYDFNGINNLKRLAFERDGISFQVKAIQHASIPEGFVGAGEPLAMGPGEPVIEWMSGPLRPMGNGRFQVALDRAWEHAASYLAIRQAGTAEVREIVQPVGVQLKQMRNSAGAAQSINFPPLPDVVAGTKSLKLHATSSAGMRVEYYVEAGPAIVRDGELVFTPIPLRAKYPIKVSVVGWQWGRSMEPKVRSAEPVRRIFHLVREPAK